jgi:hypothetical protein
MDICQYINFTYNFTEAWIYWSLTFLLLLQFSSTFPSYFMTIVNSLVK